MRLLCWRRLTEANVSISRTRCNVRNRRETLLPQRGTLHKAERRQEFLANIANNQKGTTTTEPLAVTYLWGEDESTPNTFHFFEQYKGREDSSPPEGAHFAKWEELASSDPFSAPPVVSLYTEALPADPAKQPAMAANSASMLHCTSSRSAARSSSRR